MRPTCLVTGATGFIGTHVVETLVAAGYDVRATDLPDALGADSRERGRFPSVLRRLSSHVQVVPSDVTQPETLRGLADGIDYVFHVAAIFSYSAPKSLLFRVNVEGTRNLLEEVTGKVKRAVVWGAGGVYGFGHDGPLDEDLPADPSNDYLRSKAAQEELVREYGRERGLSYAILRPTTVYGPRAVYGGGQLLMDPAKQSVLALPTNFTAKIPFVHVEDVARAALHLAVTPEAGGDTYNLNDDTDITTYDFMKYLSRLLGKPFLPLPPIPVAPLRNVLKGVATVGQQLGARLGFRSPLEADSVDYFGRELSFPNRRLKATGFRFRYPEAREGIRDTLAWYQKEGWL